MYSYRLAIDFGTTNSVVACLDQETNRPFVLKIEGISCTEQLSGKSLIPSLLYVRDGETQEVVIGQAVGDQGLDRQRDNRLFRSFKRSISRGGDLETRLIDGTPWTELEAGKLFLQKLVAAVPYLPEDVETLVISVPVASMDSYTNWISKSLPGYQPDQIQIIDESTAAALGYAIHEPGTLVLVCDFGGGSLDLSLVQLPEKSKILFDFLHKAGLTRTPPARVISKAGLSLGGSDVDQWLLAETLAMEGLSEADLGLGYAPLLSACEKAKIQLSEVDHAQISFVDGLEKEHTLGITRARFEAILQQYGFFSGLQGAVDKLMSGGHQKGIYREDIPYVLMVGGTSLIPSVQANLAELFPNASLRMEKPFTAIAEGALSLASGTGLKDTLAFSYGLRCKDLSSRQTVLDELFSEGTSIPADAVEIYLQPSRSRQQAIEVVVGQVVEQEARLAKMEYQGGQAVFVSQLGGSVQKIHWPAPHKSLKIPLDPPGKPGENRLKASFRVDADRRLRVWVEDLLSGEIRARDVEVFSPVAESQNDEVHPMEDANLPVISRWTSIPKTGFSLRSLATRLNLLPPEKVAVEVLQDALTSIQFYSRFSAAEMLGKRNDRAAREVLENMLKTGTAPQRASVAHHLSRLSWYSAEPLIRLAMQDRDERVRESAVYGLCRLGSRDAYRLLEETLPGAGETLLRAVAYGVYSYPSPGAVEVLGMALKASDPETREKALEVLGMTESEQALPLLKQALTEENPDIQYHAALSLVEIDRQDSFGLLAETITRLNGPRRLAVVKALFHATSYLNIDMGISQEAGALVAALSCAIHDEDENTRSFSAMPLSWMHHPLANQVLVDAYQQERQADVKANILRAAVDLLSSVGQQLLDEALVSDELELVKAARYLNTHRKVGVPDT